MAEPTPKPAPPLIIPGRELDVAIAMRDVATILRSIQNEETRRDLNRVWTCAKAMAHIQGSHDVFSARGDDLIVRVPDPTTGHLVTMMALHMSLWPASPEGALGILDHARGYIAYIATHSRT